MNTIVIVSSLHILVAIIQLAISGISILADRKSLVNRSVSVLLIFFAITSISISLGMNSLTLEQALPWIIVQAVSIYVMGWIILWSALIIFKPTLISRWIALAPIILLISVPIVSIIFDLSGASQIMFGQHLMLSIQEISVAYTGGYLAATDYITGLLSPFLRIQLIGSYAIAGIFPLLTTTIADRKKNPENSRFAFLLFLATAVIAPVTMVFLNVFPPTIPSLLANVSIAAGFAYIVIQRSEARFGLPGFNKMVQDYPMFNKLLVTTIGIVLPSIVMVGFSSYSYYQQTLLNLYNSTLSSFAKTEGERINHEIEELIADLVSVTEKSNVRSLLSQRMAELENLPQDEILLRLEDGDVQWQDEGSLTRDRVLKIIRTISLRAFVTENPSYRMMAITDAYGGLVIATQPPETFDQSRHQWWRLVRDTRLAYFGPPTWDETSEEYVADIAIPILGSDDDQSIDGILYGKYSVASIQESLAQASEGQITNFVLLSNFYIPIAEQLISSTDGSSSSIDLMTIDVQKDWHIINFNGEDNIAAIEKINNDKAKNNLDFSILALAPVNEALSSVFIARNGIFILIFVMLIAAIGGTIIMANLITTPLLGLTRTAEKILAGEKEIQAEISGLDEIGILASTFNRMTAEMSNLVEGLELTVEERTSDLEKRALQMGIAAQVARESAEIQNLQELLNQVVQLVSEQFNYYHAGIFLLDERGEYAVLQAANSEGGKRMLSRGHKLQVGKVGVVGFTAGSGESRIAQDVGADVVYYDNPDMPGTRSELALPLMVRGNVIGVLDVQSTLPNAFHREDLEVLQILADQIALAIDNARLLQASERTLKELENLYGQQVSQAWKQQLTGQDITYQYDPVGTNMTSRKSDKELLEGQGDLNRLFKDITFRGQVIGTIDLLREANQENWSEDEEILVEEILEQTALALENARLLDQIRLRSDQIQLLQEITALSASLMQEDDLLNAIARKLHDGLDLLECSVVLFDEDRNYASLAAKVTDLENDPPIGSMLALEADSVSHEVISRKKTLILYNIKNDPNSSAYSQTFSHPDTYSTVLLPLIARGEVIGMINLETDDPDREIDDEDKNLFAQLQTQISTALDSSRLFSAEQKGREAAAALLEISQIASSSMDVNYVLGEVAQRSAAAIQAYRCTISMIDNEDKTIKALMSKLADPQSSENLMGEAIKSMEAEEIENFPIYQQIYINRQYGIVDVSEQPELMPARYTEPFGITKILTLPLISQDKVFGVLTFDHVDEDHQFTIEQIALAQTIAAQVASTIENAQLFDQTVRRAERERLVTEITTKIRSTNDPNMILNTAVNELRQALKKPAEKTNVQSGDKPESGNTQTNNGQD